MQTGKKRRSGEAIISSQHVMKKKRILEGRTARGRNGSFGKAY